MKRILLCTADESFSRSLARLLRAAAYDVVAADGPGGLAHIERDAFDAVVTDLHMPGADGFAILDAVRAKASQIPVIVLSGGAQIQDAMCAMRLGACDFLVKPVDVESLEKALGRALRRARPPTPNAGPDAVAWGSRTASPPTGTTDLRAKLKSVEDRMVAEALVRTRGNKNRAAALLGLDRASLLEKLRRKQMEDQPPENTSATAGDKIASLSHTLFLLPLRNLVLFPGAVMPVEVGGSRSLRLVEALSGKGAHLLVGTQKDADIEEPAYADLHPIAVEAEVVRIVKIAPDCVTIVLRGLQRRRVTGFVQEQPFLVASYEPLVEIRKDHIMIEALAAAISYLAKQIIALSPDIPDQAALTLDQSKDPARVGDVAAAVMDLSVQERLPLLVEVDVAKRLRRLLALLKRRTETVKAKQKTDARLREGASDLCNQGVTSGEPSHRREAIPRQVAEERIEAARGSNASELDLHGLGLTRLPSSIGQLTKLQSLNIFRNQLSALPNAIGNLSQLRFLYISENRLTALPEAIGRLSQLQFLSASENRLTALPEAIGRLSQLHHLNLCNNRLTALPKSLRRLAGLEKLFLQENPDLGLPPKVLGPTLHHLPWGDARPADPTSILDCYFKTPVSGNRWLRLFRGLFGANVKKLKAKGDVEELFQIAIDNRNYSNRLAVQAIEELGHQAVVPLISCVKAYYRISANLSFEDIATALSGVGAAIVVPLIRLLEQSNGDIAAITALGKLKDPRAVPILCALFKLGNPLISTQVATALAAIANEEAVAALMQELEGDNFITRADAVHALGIIGDQGFIPAITKACSDPHEHVRDAAGRALHQITTRSP